MDIRLIASTFLLELIDHIFFLNLHKEKKNNHFCPCKDFIPSIYLGKEDSSFSATGHQAALSHFSPILSGRRAGTTKHQDK